MLKLFAISKSRLVANAIATAVTLRYSLNEKQVTPLFWENEWDVKKEPREYFRSLFETIEKEINDGELVHDRYIGIMDFLDVPCVESIHVFTSVQGMLILAFPEIQWIPLFQDATLWSDSDDDSVMTLDRAVTLCNGGYSPLFDGDGLRSILIERAHAGKYDPDNLHYARTDVAVSIDEETSFAAMNAYTAYRFGYRSFPITTKVAMDELFGKKDNAPRSLPRVRGMALPSEPPRIVAFEDICIEFPDANKRYNDNKIAFGSKRAENYPFLENVDLRVFTTSADDDEKVVENKKTLVEYFQEDKQKKHISEHRSWIQNQIQYLQRFLFNLTGGFWPGFWLVTSLEIALIFGSLYVSFFKCQLAFPLILLLVLIICGFLRSKIKELVLKYFSFAHRLCDLIHHREQWAFMPKYYMNHYPVSFTSGDSFWEVAHKPLSGIFGLRNKCQLPNGRNYSLLFNSDDIKNYYKAMLHNTSASPLESSGGNGHSAPGVALELATTLLHRSERMRGSIIDAEGAIHAAVLANVAVELLNYKTPSVSIEAFKWKHYYEVLAECEFVGVRANLDMNERYIDIHNGMERICRSESTGRVRDAVFLSAMAELVDLLAKQLGEKGKVEEASYFWTHSRRLHRKLMSPFGRSLLAYPEWVLRNKWTFLTSLLVFFLVFLNYCIEYKLPSGPKPAIGAESSVADSCLMAFQVMISRLNVAIKDPKDQFIVLLARQIAILHWGFAATHFFVFMNRK